MGLRVALLALALACFGWAGWQATHGLLRRPTAIADVSYAATTSDHTSSTQTLDLYLTRWRRERSPLVVLVGGDQTAGTVGESVARSLVEAGAHTAVIPNRPTQLDGNATPPSDVAEALLFLQRNVGEYGYDPTRVFLLGHGGGGGVVAAIGTEPARYGLEPSALAGVITISADLSEVALLPPTRGGSGCQFAWDECSHGLAEIRPRPCPKPTTTIPHLVRRT